MVVTSHGHGHGCVYPWLKVFKLDFKTWITLTFYPKNTWENIDRYYFIDYVDSFLWFSIVIFDNHWQDSRQKILDKFLDFYSPP